MFLQGRYGLKKNNSPAPSYPLMIVISSLNNTKKRLRNRSFSTKAKATSKKSIGAPSLRVGDLVYLYTDRNKSSPWVRYMVTSTENN